MSTPDPNVKADLTVAIIEELILIAANPAITGEKAAVIAGALGVLSRMVNIGSEAYAEQNELLERVRGWNASATGGPSVAELDELKARRDALDEAARERAKALTGQ